MGIGFPQLLLIAVIVLLLFGRGKISDLMGDVAKGIRSFRKGLADEDMPSSTTPAADAKIIDGKAVHETTADSKDKTANG
jgi:sec-independent protein translocase protein TatA